MQMVIYIRYLYIVVQDCQRNRDYCHFAHKLYLALSSLWTIEPG